MATSATISHPEIKRYINRFNGYTTTYEVWDDFDTRSKTKGALFDRIGDIWKRRCILTIDSLPTVHIILPYATELEPELFRQHMLHLIASIRKREIYYFEHNETTIRFCTAIGHNEFTPTIDINMPTYTICKDIRGMSFTFHLDMMNLYNDMCQKLPDVLNNILDTMRY